MVQSGELRDVMFCEFRCGPEISDAECRSSTATPVFYKRNLKTERFQNFHRSNSNVRLVITHEGVVPEDHVASVAAIGDRGRAAGVPDPDYSMFREPFVEAFACVIR